ncbi:hypothetical protein [Litchfieldia alkalitelluris]|uniref:hypothetical protein n=1 Tax=Litchfieldia alkalitelluris TaxID=304268 RepID=UPI00099613BC|nr:hypothetical protein [Litchfieldia alkalitelluris]
MRYGTELTVLIIYGTVVWGVVFDKGRRLEWLSVILMYITPFVLIYFISIFIPPNEESVFLFLTILVVLSAIFIFIFYQLGRLKK